MLVNDDDLELLATTRGKDLTSLRIYNSQLFSEDGLIYISKYCKELRTLCLENNMVLFRKENGEWLHELALRNMVIETLHFENYSNNYDVKDVTLLAENCCNSLVSLKISPCILSELREAFRHAIRLKYFEGAIFDENEDYSSFKFPMNISGLRIHDLPQTSFPLLLPYVNQLRELHLTCINLQRNCKCFLFERCPNLEVIDTHDIWGDTGLQVIGLCCKKLRKLTYGERVTHMGLIALAQRCYNLEYLHVRLSDISNEAMECVGTHLNNMRDLRISLIMEGGMDVPLDNGIRAMLRGCSKLRRLRISLCNGGLTDVGLGYIGKYGHNLRYLFLGCTGESDAGLLELSKGCQKLRKLILEDCPFSEQAVATFVFNIYSLRNVRASMIKCKAFIVACSMSVGDTTQRKQAVMVIGVDGKPSNAALKKIDEIPAVEEFVFLVLYGLGEEGLVHVAKYCNQLRTLSLKGRSMSDEEHGKWLHELAIHNTVLESFHCRFEFTRYEYDVQDLHLCSLSLLRDAFRHALRLEDFSGAYYRKDHSELFQMKLWSTCIRTNLKNLRHFSVNKFGKTDIPLENGSRAMLTGCNKLERLDIILRRGGLTDVGLGFIEKYGHNLKYLSLECIGESDVGLVELSKGCSRLRALRMKDCPFSEQAVSTFVFNMHSLSQSWLPAVATYQQQVSRLLLDLHFDTEKRTLSAK
nr:hypothetical protein [Tanacetum cinerariifolium]